MYVCMYAFLYVYKNRCVYLVTDKNKRFKRTSVCCSVKELILVIALNATTSWFAQLGFNKGHMDIFHLL